MSEDDRNHLQESDAMPAARIAALSLFVVLFAAAWSNDPGLAAAPVTTTATWHQQPDQHETPSHNSGLRPSMARKT